MLFIYYGRRHPRGARLAQPPFRAKGNVRVAKPMPKSPFAQPRWLRSVFCDTAQGSKLRSKLERLRMEIAPLEKKLAKLARAGERSLKVEAEIKRKQGRILVANFEYTRALLSFAREQKGIDPDIMKELNSAAEDLLRKVIARGLDNLLPPQ